MSYILALDQGTTSSRAIIFDKKNNIISVDQKEFKQFFPAPGLVEHDAMEIWDSQLKVLKKSLSSGNISTKDIAAIGITNQRETTVIWDKTTGKPVYNAIVWQDKRTANYCASLKEEGKEELITKKTGLIIDPYFSATKIKWILDNVEGAKQRAEKGELLFGTVDTWLVWNLTKGALHITDYSNASRTMLFNIHDKKWDNDLLDLLEIPEKIMPTVRQSSEVYGNIHHDILKADIPIAGIAGDQQAATFGQACLKEGMAKNTYGTGCFCLLNIGKEPVINNKKMLTTIAWGRKDSLTFALEGSVFIGGAVVQWLRDGLGFIKKSPEIEKLASEVQDNGGVYLVPAFVGLGAPYWNPYARGAIVGLTRGSTQAHIARAALESIAFQVYDVLQTMNVVNKNVSLKELRVDGGASNNDFLMQFQADILGIKVVRPKVTETTALGAAYLAGLAVGFWESAEELSSLWKEDKVFEPKINKDIKESLLYNWHNAVKVSESWEPSK